MTDLLQASADLEVIQRDPEVLRICGEAILIEYFSAIETVLPLRSRSTDSLQPDQQGWLFVLKTSSDVAST